MPGRAVITRRGSGPDLVLVHGWSMHSRIWGGFADRLAEDFTLHLVDLPGHGEALGQGSWKLDKLVCQLLSEVPPAVWLGWSLGGQVTLSAALTDPERVQALVLIGTNPRFLAGEDWPDAMPPEEFDAFESRFQADPAAMLEHFLGLIADGQSGARRTLAVLRKLAGAYPMADRVSLQDGLNVLRTTDLAGSLCALEPDVLWIAGALDRTTPAVCSERAAGMVSGSRYLCIEGACHVPFLSHPDAVLDAVLEYLRGRVAA